jgi:hypothetical protein
LAKGGDAKALQHGLKRPLTALERGLLAPPFTSTWNTGICFDAAAITTIDSATTLV